MSQQPGTAAAVWERVDRLLQDGPAGVKEIENAFTFEVYYPDFAQRVRAMREHFWGSPEPPFTLDAEGDEKRRQWTKNFNWSVKGMEPRQAEREAARFHGELRRLCRQYGLSRWSMESYLFQGVPPAAPPIRAVVRQGQEGPSYLEVRVFSSQVTPEQVAKLYEQVSEGLPALTYDRADDGDAPEAARTAALAHWTVLCLVERAGLSVDDAVREWNSRYPSMALTAEGAGQAVEELRSRAEGLFWESLPPEGEG